MTEYAASSLKLGVLPRICLMLSNSSGSNLSCLAVSTVVSMIIIRNAKLLKRHKDAKAIGV
jgi:hypothetical protein